GLVRAGAGVTLERLLGFLDEHGTGLTSVPAVGQITLGGALAIGGHGAAVPAVGEVGPAGDGYGSLSNQVVAVTAVAWEPSRAAYALRRFGRATPEGSVLALHLGRAFLTEVVLRVGPARPLRCESIFDRPASAVFAPPGRAGPDSFSGLLDRAGRVESIWFPFAERPWTKVWTVAPTKPAGSRQTTGPYNYAVTDRIPRVGAWLVDRVVAGDAPVTPLYTRAAAAVAEAGVVALGATDLWGPAHHTQLYIQATTLRYAEMGLAVRTRRRDVQRVVHELTARWAGTIEAHHRRGRYPVNGPLELRASGLDLPDVAGVAGADAPWLSALRPHADHPELDTMVWANVLTFPRTTGSHRYLTELEGWARRTFVPPLGRLRAEWSKGWAYTARGPWTDDRAVTASIPGDYRGPSAGRGDWDEARGVLDRLDPHRVFTNPFLDRLLP
ncbi:MAG TPA: cholesterol oxidase substrate-binding domain-containing protein, partial [Acidimicrobiales bacterium]|nr:cholesterol oxidase substrate-binding domain-containing protein [Acidimicrobiales bacterium]